MFNVYADFEFTSLGIKLGFTNFVASAFRIKPAYQFMSDGLL